MLINEYVKRWYNEDYDIRHEDFYIDNAYWTSGKHWYHGGIKHGIISFLISGITFLFIGKTIREGLFAGLLMLATLSFCFFFYAIREYEENDTGLSKVMYIMIFLLLFFAKNKVSLFVKWIFIIAGLGLYIYLTFIKPIQLSKTKKDMKKKMATMEDEDEKRQKAAYSKHKEDYKSYRNGLPEYEIPKGDPTLEEARKMFEGYTATQDMLKTRYRQLAKKAHPDNGGDEHLFSCIIEVYENLCKQFE